MVWDGAGAQHHVEPETALFGHVIEHDLVAAFRHDRQLIAALVRPHAETQKALAGLFADRLDLLQVTAGFGAGLMQIIERRSGQFELTCRFQAHRAVSPLHRDNLAILLDRLPAEFGQRIEEIADAAGFVIGGRMQIGAAIDEFFVLGADQPFVLRLLALGENFQQLLAVLYCGSVAFRNRLRAHAPALAALRARCQYRKHWRGSRKVWASC